MPRSTAEAECLKSFGANPSSSSSRPILPTRSICSPGHNYGQRNRAWIASLALPRPTPWLCNQQSALCLGYPVHRPLPPTRRCLSDIDLVPKEAWIKPVSCVHVPAKLWGNGIGVLLRSVCVLANIYAAPLDVVLIRMLRAGTQGAIPARLARTIQDRESELPRIPVLRNRVNKPEVWFLPTSCTLLATSSRVPKNFEGHRA